MGTSGIEAEKEICANNMTGNKKKSQNESQFIKIAIPLQVPDTFYFSSVPSLFQTLALCSNDLCHRHSLEYKKKKYPIRGLPGGPVAKTLHSHCRGPGFDPWSGN